MSFLSSFAAREWVRTKPKKSKACTTKNSEGIGKTPRVSLYRTRDDGDDEESDALQKTQSQPAPSPRARGRKAEPSSNSSPGFRFGKYTPCPLLSLLTSALTRSHLFCAVTLPDSESDAQSPRRDTNRMWYRDDDHNDLRMRHSNRIAATGLPLSRVQLLQKIEIKESSLKAALAHNEVVEKKNKDLHEQLSTILRSLECDRKRSVALASHLLSSCYSHSLKIYCHSYILSGCRDGAGYSATAHGKKL
jgi:hypothetical protein